MSNHTDDYVDVMDMPSGWSCKEVQELEDQIKELQKERDELNEALIDFDNANYDELHKICIKHRELIEKLRVENNAQG